MNLSKFVLPICLSITLASTQAQTAAPAAAAPMKVATVEVSKIVENSLRAKKIRSDRDAAMASAKEKKDKKIKEMEKAAQDLQDIKARATDPSTSEQGRALAKAEFRKVQDGMEMEAAKFREALAKEGQDVGIKTQEQIDKLAKDVFDATAKIAAARGYNVVLDTTKGRGVIYQTLGTDITDDVMRQVDSMGK